MPEPSHFARNLDAFAACQPVPADRLQAEPTRLRVEQAHGVPVLLARRGDGWVALNSRRDPVAESLRWVDAQLATTPNPGAVFVLGAGLGYVLDALDRRCPDARVIAVEPHADSARALLEHRDWSARVHAGRLRLLVGPDFAGADRLLGMLGSTRTAMVLDHPVLANTWPEEMAAARRAAAAAVFAARANETARVAGAGRYLANTLRNLATIAAESDVDRLAGLGTGMPALLVSAGPSLDQSLAAIREYGNRALIVAVDTALRPLLSAGIVPHVAVSLDCSRLNAEHLLDLHDADGVALVAEGSLNPIALEPFAGRTFVFTVGGHHPWPWLEASGCARGRLDVWGSVATAALDLIRRLGCNPVVFCGQDLAYTGGRSYCTGTTWDLMRVAAGKRPEVLSTDIHGRPVPTAPHLVSFRDWLVEQSLGDPARQYVNASAAGILHGGRIDIAPLEQALATRQPLDDASLRASIRAAHRIDPSAHRVVEQAREFAAGSESDEPLASWLAFAGPATTVESIRHALMPGTSEAAPERPAPEPAGPLPHRDLLRLGAIVADCAPGEALVLESGSAGVYGFVSSCLPTAAVHTEARGLYDLIVLDVSPDGQDPGPDIDERMRVAMRHLSREGLLVVVDLTDRVVGAPMRRAVERLLVERPDLTLAGRRTYDWFSRLTLLRRRPEGSARPAPRAGEPAGVPITRSDAELLANVIVRRWRPSRVATLGTSGPTWTDAFSSHSGVTVAAPPDASPDGRFDVVLALDRLALVEPAAERELLDRLTALADIVVVAIPTPGWELTPDANQRPLAYWADRFLERGYVLSDELRPFLEDRPDFGERLYDISLLWVARRITPPDVRQAVMTSPELRSVLAAAAGRIEDLFLQSALLRMDRREHAVPPTAPRARTVAVGLDAAAIEHSGGHAYVFRFADPALRFCLRAGLLRHADIEEDGKPLTRAQSRLLDIQAEGGGRHHVRTDGVYFSSSDRTDPRSNGRRYALRAGIDVVGLARTSPIR